MNPGRPTISVCIANYDGERMLADCIESVLSQQCDAAVEIIVHDDASNDGSVQLIHDRYPQVTLIASETNVGFCVGNNRMIDVARGDYVLLLNNDAALLPDAFAALLAEARRIAAPAILTLPQYDWSSGALVDRGCLLDPFCNPIPNLDPSRDDVAYVIGACLWCPRDAWHALGGFPEWMESIGEDLYLCSAARLRGMPVRALAASGYRHRQGASFGGNRISDGRLQSTFKRRAMSERNKTFVLFVMTPGFAMWPLLALHLAVLAFEGLALASIRRDTSIWRRIYAPAIAAVFRGRDRLSAVRKHEQRLRTISMGRYFSTVTLFPRKLSLFARHGLPTLK